MYGEAKSAVVKLNPEKYTIKIYSYKTVVNEVEDPDKEISLEEQLKDEAEEVVKGEKEVIEVYENTLNILRNTASGAINN